MAALSRQNSVADPSPQDAAGPPLPLTWENGTAFLNNTLSLIDKLEANDQTKHDRKQQCRRVVELIGSNKTNVNALQLLGANAIKTYCESKAPDSIDSYCKMSCGLLKLIVAAQGLQLSPSVCQEIAALEGMAADCEASRRVGKKAPSSLASFVDPVVKLFDKVSTEHIEISYTELALNVWLIFTVLGVATRTRTMRTAFWGENVIRLDDGDWQIKLGDDENPGTKHKFPLNVKLSALGALGQAGLLRPDMAAAALTWLWNRTEGEKKGRLVFSRNCKKAAQFGKDVFGKHMVSVLGKGMDCGLLRKRLEMDAARLAQEGTISPADRAMVSQLLQHSGKTAGIDYSDSAPDKDVVDDATADMDEESVELVGDWEESNDQDFSARVARTDRAQLGGPRRTALKKTGASIKDMLKNIKASWAFLQRHGVVAKDVQCDVDSAYYADISLGAFDRPDDHGIACGWRHIDSAKVIFDDSLTVLGYRLTWNFIECNKPLHGYKDFDMVKTIVQKWEDQQENVRDPRVDPKVPLNFTWFVDGDDQNFDAGNCVEVTPYEWFSAANGRNWCVSWDHYVHADAALTDEEKAFVMDNFDLFAAHFEPRAAESRRLLDNATNSFVQGEIGKLRTRIKALEDKSDTTDESSDEDSGDEILQALFRHGFVLKPRARRAYEQGGAVRTIARKTQHRSRRSRTQRR